MIIIETDTDCTEVEAAVRSVEGVEQVASHGNEVTIMVKDGAATISPVAVALHEANLHVRNLTLRTPTLDDVFLELTGGRIVGARAMSAVDAVASGRSIRGREAGFFADLWTIAGRALRLVPRDKEALIPALIIPVFFFAVNIGSCRTSSRSRRASTTRRSCCRSRSSRRCRA